MGISGLIPFLEKASAQVHLKDICGSTVAVDTYCWLHKGAFGCAEKLVRGENTDQYVQYCIRYVELLLSYDIKPILVFDGRHLPAKELTERRRRDARKQSRELAAELLRAGDKAAAISHMRRCVDVTHEMALRVIRECRLRNVDCIVAPFEADAQMAWLNKMNIAQYVITEDSDLTLFGAKKIIFKLDLTGAGLLVEADKLYLAMGCTKERYNFEKFRRMCILSGCDYLDSLPGIGLAKACKFFLKTEQEDMWIALKKIPAYLNMKNLQVTDEYIEQFLKAEATFRHMYIYNPFERRTERLNPLTDFNTDERYCSNAGTPIEDKEVALDLALGNLNPFTLKRLDNWRPGNNYGLVQPAKNGSHKGVKYAKHKSIWRENYKTQTTSNLQSTTTEKDKCALHFRKVDFISKTLDDEISENARAEHAKPEEAEIFSMYKNEADGLLEPSVKRRRYNGSESASDDGLGNCDVPEKIDESYNGVTHKKHNPFAKLSTTNSTKENKLPSICENASLLKVLSPKKERSSGNILRIGSILQCPKSPLERLQEKVTVKSRFFSNNIHEAKSTQTKAIKSASRDLTAEIDLIESNAQEQMQTRAMLYDATTPKKECLGSVPTNKATDNVSIEEESLSVSLEEESLSVPTKLDISFIAADNAESESESVESLEDVITLSDDNEDKQMAQKATVILFNSQPNKQRIGLSRTRTSKTKSKLHKANSKTTAKPVNSTEALQNQTRLTMFGFKKRPSLK